MHSIQNDYELTNTLPAAYIPQTAFTFTEEKKLQYSA